MSGQIYIVGGGHAGTEAAFSIARLGLKCTIITMDINHLNFPQFCDNPNVLNLC